MCEKQKETAEKWVSFIPEIFGKRHTLREILGFLQHFNTSLKGDVIFCDEQRKQCLYLLFSCKT